MTRILRRCRLLQVLSLLVPGALVTITPVSPAHGAGAFNGVPSSPMPLCGESFHLTPTLRFPRILHVGTDPVEVATSERTGHAFVLNSAVPPIMVSVKGIAPCRSSLTTADAATGRFLRIAALGSEALGMAVDDRDSRVFVAGIVEAPRPQQDREVLTVLDAQGRIVAAPRPFSLCLCVERGHARPWYGMGLRILVDQPAHRVFVFASVIAVFDAYRGRLLRTAPMIVPSALDSIVLDERRSRIFVPTSVPWGPRLGVGNWEIKVLDARTLSLIRTIDPQLNGTPSITEDQRTGLLLAAGGESAPSTNQGGATCRGGGAGDALKVLDPATGRILQTVLRGCDVFTPIIADEPAGRVFVGMPAYTCCAQYALLDSRDGRVAGYVARGVVPDPQQVYNWALDPPTGRIAFLTTGCVGTRPTCFSLLKVLGPKDWRIVQSVRLPIPRGLAQRLSEGAQRIFITNPGPGTVTLVKMVP